MGHQGVLISRIVHPEVKTVNPGRTFFVGSQAGHDYARCRVMIHARLRIKATIWAGIWGYVLLDNLEIKTP
jgi:hypothetical protein